MVDKALYHAARYDQRKNRIDSTLELLPVGADTRDEAVSERQVEAPAVDVLSAACTQNSSFRYEFLTPESLLVHGLCQSG
jgi:hypothetical protein